MWQQYTAGNCGVVVCHIDSGTHWNANNWYNAGEYGGIPLVDDDGNGACTAPWHSLARANACKASGSPAWSFEHTSNCFSEVPVHL